MDVAIIKKSGYEIIFKFKALKYNKDMIYTYLCGFLACALNCNIITLSQRDALKHYFKYYIEKEEINNEN